MKKYYIILGKHAPVAGEADWPYPDNCTSTYTINGPTNLCYIMNQIIEKISAPWWWVFDGEISESNVMLSGAIDPEDVYDIMYELGVTEQELSEI